MTTDARIESALEKAMRQFIDSRCPPNLQQALHYAVFPGGHRIRPRISFAVAAACGEDQPPVTDAAAVSIELLHCASLVHDDMPAFDDAELRRGKASVHVSYGVPLALLSGDALIVLAFQALAHGSVDQPRRLGALIDIVGNGVGLPAGIVSGQAWECEPDVEVELYHRSKTGALFAAATMAGAASAGADHEPWLGVGEYLGEAYQVADDFLDRYGDPEVIGKPVGQDQAKKRPNSISKLGFSRASRRLRKLVEAAADVVPDCPGRAALRDHIQREAQQFMQYALSRRRAA
jgi:geranylgeranyl diphosphate synthase type II